MNETVRDYCLDAGIEFTRCRPYRKNDQAWVEQKNGSGVRRTVGYRRFEGLEAAAVLARLYAALRLFVNFVQPSFKLAAKARDGAKVTKSYHPPATPCQRLWRMRGRARRSGAGWKRCARRWIRFVCSRRSVPPSSSSSGLPTPRSAAKRPRLPCQRWSNFSQACAPRGKGGEVRPTSIPTAKPKRLRRRPDPFAAVTIMLREWFEAEPWRTSRELFERLQAEHPGVYPDGQLRTCQRRLKEWRREAAIRLVFGTAAVDAINVDSKKGCPAVA
jgi:hypothetical protein